MHGHKSHGPSGGDAAIVDLFPSNLYLFLVDGVGVLCEWEDWVTRGWSLVDSVQSMRRQ